MTDSKKESQQTAAQVESSQAAESKETGTATPAAKKPPKKGWIICGVIVAVLVVAGAGFWVWHEQPSFCNAICHSPMDGYVESYYSGDCGMLATTHAKAGKNCLSCHEPVLSQQISEAAKWAGNDFTTTANGKRLGESKNFASEEFCAKSGCHTMSSVVEKTWGFEGNDAKYNPHSSHQDLALQCGDCHKVHETSVLVCNECHNLNMPEGWEAPYDTKK